MPDRPPPNEPTERDALSVAVHAVVRLAKTLEKVLATEQLSVSQYRILDRLTDGSTHGRTLAEWLAVKPPSLTTLVDGLVKRGLVDRSEDGLDRRQVTHTLTEEGRKLHHEVSLRVAERLAHIAGHVDGSTAAVMVESLASWDAALDAAREARRRDEGLAR